MLEQEPLRETLKKYGVSEQQAMAFVDVTTAGTNHAIKEAATSVVPLIVQLSTDLNNLAVDLADLKKDLKQKMKDLKQSVQSLSDTFAAKQDKMTEELGGVKDTISNLKLADSNLDRDLKYGLIIQLLLIYAGQAGATQAIFSKLFPPE
ncbi:hypothetical protein COCOBI_05-6850 [Coccomyxa sp. Obi]|nr:hypothetical protein COCOBI_05-6850 [Coccomyxa sp. Obi]